MLLDKAMSSYDHLILSVWPSSTSALDYKIDSLILQGHFAVLYDLGKPSTNEIF